MFIYIYRNCRPLFCSPSLLPLPWQATRFICLSLALAAELQRCPATSAAHTHTHTLCHTLLHRLVSIINRLARQEACAAAAHREAGKEWGGAGGVFFGVQDLAYLIIMSRAFSCSDDADDDYSNTNTPDDGSTQPSPSASPPSSLA